MKTQLLAMMAGANGAACKTPTGGLRMMCLAEQVSPKVLFWIEAWPDNQHQVHATVFDHFMLHHNRDVELLDAAGTQVAYLAPAEEWPDMNTDEARAVVTTWAHYLQDPGHREAFEQFVREERAATLD